MYHLTTFCLIASTSSVKLALLVICHFSLNLGPPLLGILVKFLLFPYTNLKLLTEFGTSFDFQTMYILYDFYPSLCNFI